MPPLLDNPAAAQSYLWAIILLPLAGALVNGLFGRRLGRGNVALIGLAMVGGAFLLSCIAFAWVAGGTPPCTARICRAARCRWVARE